LEDDQSIAVFRLLQGRKVNLRIVEKEDYPLLPSWFINLGLGGRNNPLDAQQSTIDAEKNTRYWVHEEKWFFIEKKDGNRIGFLGTHVSGKALDPSFLERLEVGYALDPAERGHAYCIDAIKTVVDDFCARVSFQTIANSENKISQRLRPVLLREETEQEWIFVIDRSITCLPLLF
jgi:hypothetical protein